MIIRPLALAVRAVRRMHVDLHRQPLGDEVVSANERASSIRSSGPISGLAGKASTSSRATWASLRLSAASAAFHSAPASQTASGAPSGSITS